MSAMQFNVQDAQRTGYWSPSTSSVDWCEANYLHTPYVAETVNTFTAFFYVFAAYINYQQIKSVKIAPMRFYILNLVFLAVALGTILFHGTLKRAAQLFDEFPMIYGISIIFYCALCNDKNTGFLKKLIVGMISFIFSMSVTFTMIYYPDNPTFFFATFTVILTTVFFMLINRARKFSGGLRLWFTAAILMIVSFALWNIENFNCELVENYYFHSLWHLGTCLGIYRFGILVLLIYLKCNNYKFHYNEQGFNFFFPQIVKEDE
eukprot:gene10229-2649_t